ncbi:MAG: hypothetical protein ACOCV2_13620 [Persicimonas sp.]
MEGKSSRFDKTIEIAEDVSALLSDLGVESAVIGAMALGVHGYARGTDDFDLGVITSEPEEIFEQIVAELSAEFDTDYRLPDASDPLGGVLTIEGAGMQPIEIVNFVNRDNLTLRSPGPAAVRHSKAGLIEDSPLKVVTLPYLVALKLFAGGFASLGDAVALLEHNPDADLEMIREVCREYGLEREFDAVVDELA